MLEHFKIAKIDSGLLPISTGRPPAATAAAPKKPVISGLGDKMRHETEMALERGLKHGALAALARFKLARGMTTAVTPAHQDLLFAMHGSPGHAPTQAMPAARPSVGWDEFRRGAAQHVADAANPGVAAMAPKVTKRSPIAPEFPMPQSANVQLHTPASGAAPAAPAAAAAAPAAAGGAGGLLSRFKMPSIGLKGALGLGALGAAGAAAWGMHRQNQQDRDANRLTYMPTQGGFY